MTSPAISQQGNAWLPIFISPLLLRGRDEVQEAGELTESGDIFSADCANLLSTESLEYDS